MRKTETAVLHLGSTKLTVMIGRRGVGGTFIVSGEGTSVYGGYKDGGLVEPENFAHNLKQALEQAEASAGIKVVKLFVGVPTDFCRVAVKDLSLSLKRSKKVTIADIDELFNTDTSFDNVEGYTRINRTALYYTTDDGRKLMDILGRKTERLTVRASYVLAEKQFISMMDNFLLQADITSVQYLSAALAEFLFLFEPENRQQTVIIADIGNMDSGIIIGQGEGLEVLKSFPCGGGFLTLDLYSCLRVSLEIAESLKRKAVLTLNVGEKDKYHVGHKGKLLPFSAKDTNQIIKDRIQQICDLIAYALKDCGIELPDYTPLYLTGGGLSYIRGVKNLMSKALNRPVEIACPKLPLMDKPELSQILGLMNLSLDIDH